MDKKIYFLALFTILSLVVVVQAQTDDVVLSLRLKYDNSGITLQEMKLIEGSPPDRLNQPSEGYTARIISFGDVELYSFKFSIELEPLNALDPSWFDKDGNQIIFPEDKIEPLTELDFVLNLPHFSNAEKVEILDMSEELILSIDVSKYATVQEGSGFFQKLAPITGSAIGIIKRPVSLVILIIVALTAVSLILKVRKNRKTSKGKREVKEEDTEREDDLGTIKCKSCGNINSNWRRFCIKCEKSLK